MTTKRKIRIGCGLCGRVLGPFQYAKIGLCNPCRSKVAKVHGIQKRHTSLTEVEGGDWMGNASAEIQAKYGIEIVKPKPKRN